MALYSSDHEIAHVRETHARPEPCGSLPRWTPGRPSRARPGTVHGAGAGDPRSRTLGAPSQPLTPLTPLARGLRLSALGELLAQGLPTRRKPSLERRPDFGHQSFSRPRFATSIRRGPVKTIGTTRGTFRRPVSAPIFYSQCLGYPRPGDPVWRPASSEARLRLEVAALIDSRDRSVARAGRRRSGLRGLHDGARATGKREETTVRSYRQGKTSHRCPSMAGHSRRAGGCAHGRIHLVNRDGPTGERRDGRGRCAVQLRELSPAPPRCAPLRATYRSERWHRCLLEVRDVLNRYLEPGDVDVEVDRLARYHSLVERPSNRLPTTSTAIDRSGGARAGGARASLPAA